MDIYRTYKFDFDENSYTKEFAHALHESGIKKPAQFNQLLKEAGIEDYDYETVKSYYYGRRAAPLKVLIAVCKKIELSADKIVIPQGIQEPAYNRDLCDCEGAYETVFYYYPVLYEEEDFIKSYGEFSAESYKECVDELSFVLSKYNYLIQKFHYAQVSDDEYAQIYVFTERHIMEREETTEDDVEKILDWIRKCDNEDFINAFYDKYTLCYYKHSCISMLELLSKLIGSEAVNYAAALLPRQDRFGVRG